MNAKKMGCLQRSQMWLCRHDLGTSPRLDGRVDVSIVFVGIPCCTPIAVAPDLMSDPKARSADTSLPLHAGTGQLGERKENGVFAEVAEVAVLTAAGR